MKKISSILLYLFCLSASSAQNGIQSEKKNTTDSILNTALNKTLEEINDRFEHVDVEIIEWPDALQKRLM